MSSDADFISVISDDEEDSVFTGPLSLEEVKQYFRRIGPLPFMFGAFISANPSNNTRVEKSSLNKNIEELISTEMATMDQNSNDNVGTVDNDTITISDDEDSIKTVLEINNFKHILKNVDENKSLLANQTAPEGLFSETVQFSSPVRTYNAGLIHRTPGTPAQSYATQESFEEMEKQVECEHANEDLAFITASESPQQSNYNTAQNTDSDESRAPENAYQTAQNSSDCSEDSANNHLFINSSPETIQTDLNKSVTDEAVDDSRSGSIAVSDDSVDHSREFNDTLEEIEHFMKYGNAYMMSGKNDAALKQLVTPHKLQENSPSRRTWLMPPLMPKVTRSDSKVVTTQVSFESKVTLSERKIPSLGRQTSTESTNCAKTLFKPFTKSSPTSPVQVHQYTYKKKKEYYPLPKGLCPVKSPLATPNTPLFKLPPAASRLPRLATPKNNYDKIISPIGLYMQSSSNLRPIQIVRHKHDLRMEHLTQQSKISAQSKPCDEFKENCAKSPQLLTPALPMKGYKMSTFAKVTKELSPKMPSLTKNDKMRKLIEARPAQTVIRHQERIKEPHKRLVFHGDVDDSFKDLSVSSADTSLYVTKDALHKKY